MKHHALLLSVAAVLSSIAVGTAATFALFRDSKENLVGLEPTITATKLCLSSARDANDNVPGPMFYMTGAQGNNGSVDGRYPLSERSNTSPPTFVPETPGNWAPGDGEGNDPAKWIVRTLTVSNGGFGCDSVAAKLTHVTGALHAGSYEPLAHKMQVWIYAPGFGTDVLLAHASLSDFLTPTGVELHLGPGGPNPDIPGYSGIGLPPNLQMKFRVSFDRDTPNEYQNGNMVVDFTVHAEQLPNNP